VAAERAADERRFAAAVIIGGAYPKGRKPHVRHETAGIHHAARRRGDRGPSRRALEIAVAGGHHLLTKKGTAIGDV